MRTVDVIVCGAGLAGCVTAGLLADQGYKVLLADRGEGSSNLLPESWFPSITPGLKQLGLENEISSALNPHATAAFCSADGTFVVEMRSKGLQSVDRNRLGQIFLKKALEKGAEPFLKTQIVGCEIQTAGAVVSLKKEEQVERIRSSYVVDATGKSAFLSHLLKLSVKENKLDPRVAYFSHFESIGAMPDSMKIVAISGGYLFCIPVGKNRISVGCVIAEHEIDRKAEPEQIFFSKLASSGYITEILQGAKKVLPVIEAKNFSRVCLEPAGDSYLLVGDAAIFFDPFFCSGIDFAIFSAEQAALSIQRNDSEKYKEALVAWFQHSEGNVYEKMQHSAWQDVMRLFADPHLPWAISSSLVQSFSNIVGGTLKQKVAEARKAYEMACC